MDQETQKTKDTLFKRTARAITEPVGGARGFAGIVAAGAAVYGSVYAFTEASEIVAAISAFTTWEMGYRLAHYHRENRGVVSSVVRLAVCGAVVFGGLFTLSDKFFEPQMKQEVYQTTEALRAEAMKQPWVEGTSFHIKGGAGQLNKATVLSTQDIKNPSTGSANHFAFILAEYSVGDWTSKTRLPLQSVLLTGLRPGSSLTPKETQNLPLPHDLRRGKWRTVKIADAASQKTL